MHFIYFRDNKEKEYHEAWISSILECIADVHKLGASNCFEPIKNVLTLYIPKGLLIISVKNRLEHQNIKLIMTAISEGNAVIVVTDSEAETVSTALSKFCPDGVLNICFGVDAVFEISGRQDLTVFIENEEANPVFTHFSVVDKVVVSYSNSNILKKVTFVKNVWF